MCQALFLNGFRGELILLKTGHLMFVFAVSQIGNAKKTEVVIMGYIRMRPVRIVFFICVPFSQLFTVFSIK